MAAGFLVFLPPCAAIRGSAIRITSYMEKAGQRAILTGQPLLTNSLQTLGGLATIPALMETAPIGRRQDVSAPTGTPTAQRSAKWRSAGRRIMIGSTFELPSGERVPAAR